ncbi:MAG: citrate/2-methylcitrate synthase [Firmicutes bacterium]|nr:citrate/2-methylcitrate synthase [Bacillota bacterium]
MINKDIQALVLEAGQKSKAEKGTRIVPQFTEKIKWPVNCTIGPGLEGAIACESAVGYIDGTAGKLLYRGYDIYELCAYSHYEEVSFLLLHGYLPTAAELYTYQEQLARFRSVPDVVKQLASVNLDGLSEMAALRLGVLFLRQAFAQIEAKEGHLNHAAVGSNVSDINFAYCYQMIASLPTIVAAIYRLREGKEPIEPDPDLSHAANFLYMLKGSKPAPEEEKVLDIALILHADHGMNASTLATMVVASTLSDLYFAVGAGIAALNGPLHGGANEDAIKMLQEIDNPENVTVWLERKLAKREKVPGFGHRVYKTIDPRARILRPLAKQLAAGDPYLQQLCQVAETLEREMAVRLGKTKKVYPNVDFYSGLVYLALGIETRLFTPIFAISRVAGWTARTMEYLENNRIFRPRAVYTGPFDVQYVPLEARDKKIALRKNSP